MKKLFAFIIYIVIFSSTIFAQSDLENNFLSSYLSFENAFQGIGGDYGNTFFPFLLNGYGGRQKGLSNAFTAVADDITTLESNPAGTASLKFTEVFFSHHKLMGDVNYDVLAYSMRFNGLGFGVGARILYMPFTHFDQYGADVGSGMITYSVFTFNVAYNFLRSYKYFGLSIGGNVKLYVYGVPNNIAQNQTIANVAFDFGILSRFNFLKAYKKIEKNFSIGLSLKNFGLFTDGEAPPSMVSIGIGYKPIYQLLFSTDFNYLISYSEFTWQNWSVSVGIEWKFIKNASLLTGITIKSNPSFSLGINVDFEDFSISAVYTPDLIDLFQFSISASLKLGDLGRKNKKIVIKKMFADALRMMNNGDYLGAKQVLKEILKKDFGFTPAYKRLEICNKQLKIQNSIETIQNTEKDLY